MKRKTLVLSLLTAIYGCSDPQTESRELVEVARTYIEQGKIREAGIELKNAIKADQANGEARYALGNLYIFTGDADSAEKEFGHALNSDWSKASSEIGLMRAMLLNNKSDEVLQISKPSTAYTPSQNADISGLRAEAYLKKEDVNSALDELVAGEKFDDEAFYVLRARAQFMLASNNRADIVKVVERALALYPDNRDFLLLDAQSHYFNGDMEGTIEVLERIVEMDPDDYITIYGRNALTRLIRISMNKRDFESADVYLTKLRKQFGGLPEIRYLSALVAFEKGDLDQSEQLLLKVLKVAPDNPRFQLLYGTVSFMLKNYEQAAHYLSRYITAHPENVNAKKLLGRTYIILGQHDSVSETLRPSADEDDAELIALLGLSKLKSGDVELGIADLLKAVDIDPENALYRGELAKAYMASGKPGDAITELTQMIASGQYSQSTEVLLIMAYVRAGEADRAVDSAIDLLSRNPDDIETIILVGNVFAVSRDFDEARGYYQKALDKKPGNEPALMAFARLAELEGDQELAKQHYSQVTDIEGSSLDAELALARIAEMQADESGMVSWLKKAREKAGKDNIRPSLMLAEYYLRENMLDEASEIIGVNAETKPEDFSVIAQTAKLRMAAGKYNESVNILSKLVISVPDSFYARTLLGESFLNLGRIDDAIEQLELSEKKRADYLPNLVLLTTAYQKQGKTEVSLSYIERIVEGAPGSHIGYELMGNHHMTLGAHKDAVDAFSKAWGITKNRFLALKLGEAYVREGQEDAAIALLRNWANDHPSDARILQFLGTTYQNAGHDDHATRVYAQLLEVEPDNVYALNNQAWLYSLKGDDRALDMARAAFRLDPENPGVQDTYGWVLLESGDAANSLPVLKKAYSALSSVPEVKYHYASALIKTGSVEQGQRLIKELFDSGVAFVGKDKARELLQ